MFGGYWSSASGDIKHFICYVITQNHMVEESYIFMSGSSSLDVTTLLSLVAIGIAVVEI